MARRVAVALMIFASVWLFLHRRALKASEPFGNSRAAHRMPEQESQKLLDLAPDTIPTFFLMNDPAAGYIIVRDIGLGADAARWTFEHPTMKFSLNAREGQRFAMDFTIVDTTFKTTGPQNLTVVIGGHKLGEMLCDRPDRYHFEKPVPPEWLSVDDPVTVEAFVDKFWIAPTDGARLGYMLSGAGFLH